MEQIKVEKLEAIRLDHFLVDKLDLSRSRISQLIKSGDILVNDQVVKQGYMLKTNDIVTIKPVETKTLDLKPVDLNLEIVYEDEHLLVVNKPKGLVVHPAKSHMEETLVHGLLHEMDELSDINGYFRPGIIHRIDKDTSGLLIVAKTNEAHQILASKLKDHDINRSYMALVYGTFEESKGIINAPIGRHPKQRIKNAVVKEGKHAVTHFEVIETFKDFSLLKCELETGRTHQIRVHLQFINHPIVGDPLYGFKPLLVEDGQMLHAYKLEFEHPITKKAMTFEAPLPDSFKAYLEKLR
ncbi:Ribosomal large subunit pseudouridine synthase D [Acholeplasma oculi]|uniref:Pseudouridine synthase n=1 Tax=Acholeplasma oculi TaxID=35623 RepID=A0A061AHA0_9MOLU|nr:RluA family pseudouridine synthase [Acholeplasma oculi]CDR30996.1 Ribosomal large subunit pseudouridine synthase D, RluD [Acholeplasma oculi]SKC36129.1 ribosomal large subunit pseudouridine synthase D [Acholeplasma oculi]SUT90415.1 Ribosomal large subunit pseudouridine synthase D [Acholeplasma oculi]